jgi:hypothetical protein
VSGGVGEWGDGGVLKGIECPTSVHSAGRRRWRKSLRKSEEVCEPQI